MSLSVLPCCCTQTQRETLRLSKTRFACVADGGNVHGCAQNARSRQPLRVQAARVGGVDIPNQKAIEFSLQYIYGIGHTTAKAILADTVSCWPRPAAALTQIKVLI